MKKIALTAALVLSSSLASAVTIDFDHLSSNNNTFSSSLSTNGFHFDNRQILHWGSQSLYNADQGGATYSHNWENTTTTVTQIGGGSFTVNSLDIGNVYNNSPTVQSFNFWADLNGGGTISRTFTSDALPGLETVLLNFTDVTAFYFTETTGRFLQADNFVFNEQISAVPVPAAFWLFATALTGFCGFNARRRKIA